MLRMRFWPMTARPMSAMSAFGSMFSSSKRVTIQKPVRCARSFFVQPECRECRSSCSSVRTEGSTFHSGHDSNEAPTTPGTAEGEEVLVPYIADYYFYQAE